MGGLPPAVPIRVLIVEDDADLAEGLALFLRTAGHVVGVARDVASGIACAFLFQPDVVISDIGLPGVNGYELARTLRATPGLRDCYLVALTGYAYSEDVKQALLAGFDEHLAKPAEPATILGLLARLASDRAQRRDGGASVQADGR